MKTKKELEEYIKLEDLFKILNKNNNLVKNSNPYDEESFISTFDDCCVQFEKQKNNFTAPEIKIKEETLLLSAINLEKIYYLEKNFNNNSSSTTVYGSHQGKPFIHHAINNKKYNVVDWMIKKTTANNLGSEKQKHILNVVSTSKQAKNSLHVYIDNVVQKPNIENEERLRNYINAGVDLSLTCKNLYGKTNPLEYYISFNLSDEKTLDCFFERQKDDLSKHNYLIRNCIYYGNKEAFEHFITKKEINKKGAIKAAFETIFEKKETLFFLEKIFENYDKAEIEYKKDIEIIFEKYFDTLDEFNIKMKYSNEKETYTEEYVENKKEEMKNKMNEILSFIIKKGYDVLTRDIKSYPGKGVETRNFILKSNMNLLDCVAATGNLELLKKIIPEKEKMSDEDIHSLSESAIFSLDLKTIDFIEEKGLLTVKRKENEQNDVLQKMLMTNTNYKNMLLSSDLMSLAKVLERNKFNFKRNYGNLERNHLHYFFPRISSVPLTPSDEEKFSNFSEFLINKGVSLTKKNNNNETPLNVLCESDRNQEILKRIIPYIPEGFLKDEDFISKLLVFGGEKSIETMFSIGMPAYWLNKENKQKIDLELVYMASGRIHHSSKRVDQIKSLIDKYYEKQLLQEISNKENKDFTPNKSIRF